MLRPEPGRREYTAADVILAVLVVATALYLVPSLALAGAVVAAAIGATLWLVGAAALWLVLRREARRRDAELAAATAAAERLRRFVDRSAEAFLILDPDGDVTFASANIARVLGIQPQVLTANGGALDIVLEPDRRRVLQAFSRLRRSPPGAAESLEVRTWHPDGSEGFLDVSATNLAHDPAIGGILVALRDITPRKTFETEIHHLAYYDALTGLANRRFFFEQGGHALALARRNGHASAVLYIDLDRFKQVNDVLGHEAGDALLKDAADGMRRSLRDSDIVARLGGDEFAVILTEVRDPNAAGLVARRIIGGLPTSALGDGHEVPIGASVGIAMFPGDGADLEELLKAADLAMYRAKADDSGVQFYRAELRLALSEQMRFEQDMRRALEHHEFHLHYQPIYSVMTGEMVGAEALSRWRHFTRGMVQASEFIRLAEQAGLIRSLDRWAIARAIQQRRTMLDAGWVGWVAVNLSPSSISDTSLPSYIRQILEAAGLEPGALVLELPEAAVLDEPDAAADLMWELKNTGAAIAVDDYGGGGSSFRELRRLPIDILKLHPAFVRGIGQKTGDESLIEGTISIAHGIRSKVLAKGIERDDQVEWLRDAGCDFVQGYLIAPPMAPEDLHGHGDRKADARA